VGAKTIFCCLLTGCWENLIMFFFGYWAITLDCDSAVLKKVKKISMTSNVLPLHFSSSQASSSQNSSVDNTLLGYKIKSALPYKIFANLNKKKKKEKSSRLRNHYFVFLLKLALKILKILFPVPVYYTTILSSWSGYFVLFLKLSTQKLSSNHKSLKMSSAGPHKKSKHINHNWLMNLGFRGKNRHTERAKLY